MKSSMKSANEIHSENLLKSFIEICWITWNPMISVNFMKYCWFQWNPVGFDGFNKILWNFWISWNPVAFNKIVLDFMKSCKILLNFMNSCEIWWICEIQQILVQIWWTSGGFQVMQFLFRFNRDFICRFQCGLHYGFHLWILWISYEIHLIPNERPGESEESQLNQLFLLISCGFHVKSI